MWYSALFGNSRRERIEQFSKRGEWRFYIDAPHCLPVKYWFAHRSPPRIFNHLRIMHSCINAPVSVVTTNINHRINGIKFSPSHWIASKRARAILPSSSPPLLFCLENDARHDGIIVFIESPPGKYISPLVQSLFLHLSHRYRRRRRRSKSESIWMDRVM